MISETEYISSSRWVEPSVRILWERRWNKILPIYWILLSPSKMKPQELRRDSRELPQKILPPRGISRFCSLFETFFPPKREEFPGKSPKLSREELIWSGLITVQIVHSGQQEDLFSWNKDRVSETWISENRIWGISGKNYEDRTTTEW